jgi:hypothetical protein
VKCGRMTGYVIVADPLIRLPDSRSDAVFTRYSVELGGSLKHDPVVVASRWAQFVAFLLIDVLTVLEE